MRISCFYYLSQLVILFYLPLCLSGCGEKTVAPEADAVAEITLTQAYEVLQQKKFVDLTHAFEPGIPHWPGFPNETVKTIYWYDKQPDTLGSGFFAQLYCHVGQWGTHADPPAHFVKGGRTLDQIDVKEMIMPLVLFDVLAAVEQNPDYTITMDDIRQWEAKYGPVPPNAFAVMRTDWSKRWPDDAAMHNRDKAGSPTIRVGAGRCCSTSTKSVASPLRGMKPPIPIPASPLRRTTIPWRPIF